MPIYEYACLECASQFEVRASISQKEKGLKVTCPDCGSLKAVQIFLSAPAVGSGKSRSGGSFSGGFGGCDPGAGAGCC